MPPIEDKSLLPIMISSVTGPCCVGSLELGVTVTLGVVVIVGVAVILGVAVWVMVGVTVILGGLPPIHLLCLPRYQFLLSYGGLLF